MTTQELQNKIDELSKLKYQIQTLSNNPQSTDNEELSTLRSDMRQLFFTLISNKEVFSVNYKTLKEKCLNKLKESFPEEHFEFNNVITDSSIIGCCSDPTIHITYSITIRSATEAIEFILNTDGQLTEETEIPLANCLQFPFILSQLNFPETSSEFHRTLKKVFWEIIEENANSCDIKIEPSELPFI